MAWHVGWPGAVALWLFLAFYLASAIGVEIGFHRYFTHRAFKCGPTLRLVLAAFGSMAGEGPVLFWAATHRRHHSHSHHRFALSSMPPDATPASSNPYAPAASNSFSLRLLPRNR